MSPLRKISCGVNAFVASSLYWLEERRRMDKIEERLRRLETKGLKNQKKIQSS